MEGTVSRADDAMTLRVTRLDEGPGTSWEVLEEDEIDDDYTFVFTHEGDKWVYVDEWVIECYWQDGTMVPRAECQDVITLKKVL